MTIDVTKTHSVDNGLSPGGESNPGIFSGAIDPNTDSGLDDAVLGSYYLNSSIEIWHKHVAGANGWHLIYSHNTINGRNDFSMLLNTPAGENVNTGAYEEKAFRELYGPDQYLTGAMFEFAVIAEASSGGSVDVRLVERSTGDVVGTLSFTETVPTLKTVDVTSLMKNGVIIYAAQAKRTGGTGKLYDVSLTTSW